MSVALQKTRGGGGWGGRHWETSLKNIKNVNEEIFFRHLLIVIVKQSALFFSVITGLPGLSGFLQCEAVVLIKKKKKCVLFCLGSFFFFFFHVRRGRNLSEQGLCEWDKVWSLFCFLISILCSLSTATAPVGIDNNNRNSFFLGFFFFCSCFFCRWICGILKYESRCQVPVLNTIFPHLVRQNSRKNSNTFIQLCGCYWPGLY